MEINEKYVKQPMDALADSRMTTSIVANQIAQFPAREQIRFFKLAITYIEIIAEHAEKGYALLGLQEIVKACGELMEVVELHFPKVGAQDQPLPGLEYVQI